MKKNAKLINKPSFVKLPSNGLENVTANNDGIVITGTDFGNFFKIDPELKSEYQGFLVVYFSYIFFFIYY